MWLVILPQLGEDGKRTELHPVGEDDGLIERYSLDNLAGLLELRNKQPVWSNETESYVLNFLGRVTRVSTKLYTGFLSWRSGHSPLVRKNVSVFPGILVIGILV